jgi:hypothetical protein
MGKIVWRAAEAGARPDHYAVVAEMVAAVSQDHAQLRQLIYEFARTNLRKDLYRQYEQLGWTGIAAQVLALEAAIDQVEADLASNALATPSVADAVPELSADKPTTNTDLVPLPASQTSLFVADDNPRELPRFLTSPTYPLRHTLYPTIVEHDAHSATALYETKPISKFWWGVQLVCALALGVGIYVASNQRATLTFLGLQKLDQTGHANLNTETAKASGAAQTITRDGNDALALPKTPPRPGIPNLPTPSAYGIYAVSNGQLTELDLLPIKVPDQRVALSTLITTPSRAHLPLGQLQFVVFRRDLANDAPDRVAIRVVAQVARALTFDAAGKPTVANIEGSWVVRSNAYQMRVAPVEGNSEMIVIRPEHPEVLFPAGRYALVLKGIAYDFTLDGPMTDTAHCLERTDALNAPIYTECRNL